MSIKQKITNFVSRHRLLVLALLLAVLVPGLSNAAGDIRVKMISSGRPYLYNKVLNKNMSANRMVDDQGRTYYCVSKGLRGPGYMNTGGNGYGLFSSPIKANDLAKKILVLGYPNRQIAGFSDNEQYHITQNALWVALNDYNLVNAPQMRHSKLENLRAGSGVSGRARNQKILQAVKDLYQQAQVYDINKLNPGLKLTQNLVAKLEAESLIAGPYKVEADNLSQANLKLTASGANQIKFFNSARQSISHIGLGQEFYVSWPKTANNSEGQIEISLSGDAKYQDALIYQAPNRKMQDMIGLVETSSIFVAKTKATWRLDKTARIRIIKLDAETKQPLAGARIEVYDAKKNRVFFGMSNQAGQVMTSALPLGQYYYKEITAPAGYYLEPKLLSLELKAENELTVVTLMNKPIPNTKLEIRKLDATSSRGLGGAKIEVYQANKLIFSGLSDQNGLLRVGDLKPGNYSYKEVAAPFGYYRDERIYHFMIRPGESKKSLEFKNKAIATIEVCRISDSTIIKIPETSFDKRLHSKNLKDCQKIEVCRLKDKTLVNISEKEFNPKQYSRNLQDCIDEIEVCNLKTKELVKIKQNKFDAKQHSQNFEDCKISVCNLKTKEIVKIQQREFDRQKHSKRLSDCQTTPKELPHTGPLETVAALIAITAVSLSVVYWYKSDQAVKRQIR